MSIIFFQVLNFWEGFIFYLYLLSTFLLMYYFDTLMDWGIEKKKSDIFRITTTQFIIKFFTSISLQHKDDKKVKVLSFYHKCIFKWFVYLNDFGHIFILRTLIINNQNILLIKNILNLQPQSFFLTHYYSYVFCEMLELSKKQWEVDKI